jgi:hypothetical protein
MEWWSNGILNTAGQKPMMVQFYFPPCTIDIKTDLIPPNPILQDSIIPLPLGIHLRRSQAALTWLSGPSFQYWNKDICS